MLVHKINLNSWFEKNFRNESKRNERMKNKMHDVLILILIDCVCLEFICFNSVIIAIWKREKKAKKKLHRINATNRKWWYELRESVRSECPCWELKLHTNLWEDLKYKKKTNSNYKTIERQREREGGEGFVCANNFFVSHIGPNQMRHTQILAHAHSHTSHFQ